MFPVVHFEIPTSNRDKISAFYEKAFGWKMQKLGEKNGNYTLIHTAETDDKGMLKEPGRINGGFYIKEGKPQEFPSVVIAVTDIKAAMKAVTDAGGKVLGEPMEIPDYGMYVSFLDTDGNRLSVMQPTNM